MSTQNQAIMDKFIASWQNHDIKQLTEMFSDGFEYKIAGEVRFNDIKTLRGFWAANKMRQNDLKIRKYFQTGFDKSSEASFSAAYYDPRRFQFVMIIGRIELKCNSDGLITELNETYTKAEIGSRKYALGILVDFLTSKIEYIFKSVFDKARSLFSWIVNFAYFVGVLILIYVNFLHQPLNILSDEIVNILKPQVPYFFAGLYLLQSAMPYFKSKIAPDIKIKALKANQDLEIMAQEIDQADSVCILSGDFSFVSKNRKLEAVLRDLAFGGKLELFSYKDEDSVLPVMRQSTAGTEIYLALKDRQKINFNVPMKSKFTLIESGGKKKMLFRFKKFEDAREIMAMGVVLPRDNTQYLLDIVEQLFNSIRQSKS